MVKEIEQRCLNIIGHDDKDEDEILDPLSQRSYLQPMLPHFGLNGELR
ncbi:hypothetical protein Tco_1077307, partial [Tanacetum coccineum]